MLGVDLGFYLQLLRKRLPLVAAIIAAAVIVAGGAAYLLPPVYSSSAKILVEAPLIPAELARSTVPVEAIEQLQIIQQQITSRDSLLDLARSIAPQTQVNLTGNSEEIVRDLRSRIGFEQVQLDLRAAGKGGAMIFNVSFRADSPDAAARTANQIADMILARNQQKRTDRAGDTLKFFDAEVARLGAELSRAEAEIMRFKTDNHDSLPESVEFLRMQQVGLQSSIASLERDEFELRNQRNSLVAGFTSGADTSGSVATTPEQQALANMNKAMADQLAIFSETSPNIQALRNRIGSVERNLLKTIPQDAQADQNSAGQRPLGLTMQVSEIEKRLAVILDEKRKSVLRMGELTRSIAATPASEIVLTSMERNRQNLQLQYNTAIARRADASMGEQIEMRADGGRFSLLETAIAPERRISPKRTQIVAIGAALGVALGLACVVLLELLNNKVRRPADLTRLLQYEPFATIPPLNGKERTGPRARLVASLPLIVFLSSSAIVAASAGGARPGLDAPFPNPALVLIGTVDGSFASA